jgi:excinuclease ABC subunit B
MQRAMDEMSRRREVQVKFNKDNNITPTSIVKDVKDIMEGARVTKKAKKTKPQSFEKELPFKISNESPEKIATSITKLEEQMYIYAKETEYEKAAFCRDQIKNLKWQLLNS